MKKIKLTKNKFAMVDDEVFDSLKSYKWFTISTKKVNYAAKVIRVGGKQKIVYMHRSILEAPKGLIVDHINHNGLDNRKKNLRLCSYSQNGQNRTNSISNKSGFKGVHLNPYKKGYDEWKVSLKFNGHILYLGKYKDIQEAKEVYNNKAKELFGEFALLN